VVTFDSLRCLQTNARSIFNKFSELQLLVSQYNPHIIGITETWLDSSIKDSEIHLDNYTIFRNDRSVSCGGGVLLYIDKSLSCSPCQRLETVNFNESLWCLISLPANNTLLVGLVYRSPSSNESNNSKLLDIIHTISLQQRFNQLLLIGDFNLPDIVWTNHYGSSSPTSFSAKFLDSIQDSFLSQHTTQPTRHHPSQRSSILDLIITNDADNVSNLAHLPPLGSSDHDCLVWQLCCGALHKQNKTTSSYNYFRGDYDSLNSYFTEMDWSSEFDGHDIDHNYNSFVQIVSSAIDIHIPRVSKANNTKPSWWSKKLSVAICNKKRLFSKWKTTKTNSDYQTYAHQRNTVKSMIRSAQLNYESKLIQLSRARPRVLYSYINSKQKNRSDITHLQKPDGSITTSDAETSEELNNFFKSTFTLEEPSLIPAISSRTSETLSDINVSEELIFQKLISLNGNKAPGPDALHPHFLKSCAASLSRPLFLLTKQSLDSGTLPDLWKKANVTPIFKKGSRFHPSNYRPISLTSQVVKLIESIIRECLWDFLDQCKALNPNQHGFVKHRSCFTNLLECHSKWSAALDSGFGVDVIYLDYSKAFDSVPHLRLLSKLQSYGINGKLLLWIKNFLIGRKQRVVLNGSSSGWVNVTSGVPQGSVLGPLLFILYVNDITDGLQSTLEMFADDSKLYRIIKTLRDVEILQEDLNFISNWSKLWLLKFNTLKCTVIHLGQGDHNTYTLYDQTLGTQNQLESTTEQRDLGIWITPDMSPSFHCHKIASNANQILGRLKRSFRNRSAPMFTMLYKTLVRPHLEYCAPIWSPHLAKDIDVLEKVQRRATKLITSISTLSYECRLRELDLHSLYCRRQRGDLIEVFKILNSYYQIDPNEIFTLQQNSVTRGNQLKLFKPRVNRNTGKHFFNFRVIQQWNDLPDEVVLAEATSNFKHSLDQYWTECGYGHCQRPLAY